MNVIDINAAVDATPAADQLGWMRERNDSVFNDLDRLHNRLADRRERSESQTVKNRELRMVAHPDPQTVDDLHQLQVSVDDSAPRPLTYHGFGQLAGLAKAPAGYLRGLPGPIAADCLRYGLEYARNVEEVKTYTVDGAVSAVTGPNYGRIYDAEVVHGIMETMDPDQWGVATDYMAARATDRSLLVFMVERESTIDIGLAPDGTRDTLKRGVMVRNSEFGAASLSISTFLFRSYCTNGLVFGQQGKSHLSMRHSSGAPERWLAEVKPAIEQYVQGAESGIVKAIDTARARKVAEDNDAMTAWLRNRAGCTAQVAQRAMDRHEIEEGRPMRSMWDAMQGITAVARSERLAEDRLELEQKAGVLFSKIAA